MDGKVWLPILDRLAREHEVITVGLEEPQTRGLQRYDPVSSSFPTPSGASSKRNGGFYGKSYFRHVILYLARPATSTQHIGPSITGFRSTKADEGKRRRVVSAGFVPTNQWAFSSLPPDHDLHQWRLCGANNIVQTTRQTDLHNDTEVTVAGIDRRDLCS